MRRTVLTGVIATVGLLVHLAVQRLAPGPVIHAGDGLVGLTPFLPWTVWIYTLFFPFELLAGALVAPERWLRLMLAWTLAAVTAWIVILFFPITFDRPDPSTLDPVHAWALGRLYALDSRHLTFPCLHAAGTWLSWLALRDRGRALRRGLFVLAVAITLSTMTLRQHLLTDNLAGVALALVYGRLLRLPGEARRRRPGQPGRAVA